MRDAYRRWAPVYDYTFGASSPGGPPACGRGDQLAAAAACSRSASALACRSPDYEQHLEVVGIDLSPEMLEKARERVDEEGLDHVTGLHEMDAGDLKFPDASFDTVVAMFVMTVVPEPETVMRELARVTKPGGEVLLVNHFSQREGVRGWVERRMAPFADKIGWRSVFDISRVTVCDDLELVERKALRPWGLFTMLRFAKRDDAARRPLAAE